MEEICRMSLKYSFKISVNIMFGCNNFCSYCIVHMCVAGENHEPKDIREIERDVAGWREGNHAPWTECQFLAESGKPNQLCTAASEIEGRKDWNVFVFVTSHRDLSDDDCCYGAIKKICRHLHLPLRSGESSRILKLMNRKYQESYLDLVDRIVKRLPGYFFDNRYYCRLSGRNRRGFLETMDMVEKVGLFGAFTFILFTKEQALRRRPWRIRCGRCHQESI